MNITAPIDVDIYHFHLFCGLGGGAKGFNRGRARVGNLRGRFRCIGGVDVDPASIRDFTRAAGVPGTVLDMFSREQYVAFHSKEPPAGWREATTADLHLAAHGQRPNIVFLSAPCKGFSGLLPEASSQTAKYQALNQLTLRGVWLMLEAWKNDPPELIIFENVPRIANRGRPLLNQIQAILRSYGYAVAETTHDCGVLGGLGQSRKRFLMVARHEAKVPPYLYQPEKKRLRGVGEVLEKLPLPGDERGGPMHRMPALQWKTWVRLAFVEAGADWRSLNRLTVEDGVLSDFAIVPEIQWQGGVLGVHRWEDPTGVVTGRGTPTTGAYSVADPRTFDVHHGSYGVNDWESPSNVVTSDGRPASGVFSVADPRPIDAPHHGSFGVNGWDETAGVVTSARAPGQGVFSVADPRVDGHEKSVQLGVRTWSQPAGVVTGKMFVGGGPNSIADPRPNLKPGAHQSIYRIVEWEKPAGAITGARHTAGGAAAVADPRPVPRDDYKQTKYRVTGFDEPCGAVIAASTTGTGAYAVADPRTGFGPNSHRNKLKVVGFGDVAGTVTGSDRVGPGAMSVADPRPAGLNAKRDAFKTGGHYGVLPWSEPAGAVPAFAKNNNGPWSVADPRNAAGDEVVELPKPNDRLVAVIRAVDGTWHRPFTTLELAALQSLVDPDEIFTLDGASDSAWRERIGNAVPPDAAEAVASVMGTTLLLALAGETFMLSSQPIWVQPLAIALAVDQHGNIPAEAAEL